MVQSIFIFFQVVFNRSLSGFFFILEPSDSTYWVEQKYFIIYLKNSKYILHYTLPFSPVYRL